ncbi:MAG: tRNA pseudouridine(38-40) synthase TruA [Ruminococcaceae bacterium]|nr:tRNA pseudouridine(38-40) synthase TruA [Oscillospiraceae bacterium]
MKYLCYIRYVGTHFCGFQAQKEKRTVQGTLTEILEQFFESPVMVTGCSRTDSGVHADGFALTVALADGSLPVPPEKLSLALAPYMPPDLSLYRAQAVEDGFHPRYDAKGKEYRYSILAVPVANPFYKDRAWQVYYPFLPDALERMNRAASHLVGTHDFSAFRAEGSPTKTPVRTVFDCHVERKDALYTVVVTGDGFLYNMVRIITGTLLAVATGRIAPDATADILASGNRTAAGATAPPEGLCLARVLYDEADFLKKTRD